MKRLLLFLQLLLIAGCASQTHTYKATDSHIRVMGRHTDKDGAVQFGASGVSFFIHFQGTRLDAKLQDEFRDSSNYNWFTVSVDDKQPTRFCTRQGTQRYTLTDSLLEGEHTLILTKDTEGQNGHNTLEAVYATKLLQADPLPDHKIEYIGDSITAGYGVDTLTVGCKDKEGTWFDHTNAWQAYGPVMARSLHAQWVLSSVSGMGMHRNWNSPSPVMPDVYPGVYMEYTQSMTPWDFSKYTPGLVVIALGTNDFSDGGGEKARPALDGDAFISDYVNFIGTVHEKYPGARFMLLNSPMLDDTRKEKLGDYLQQVVSKQQAVPDSSITTFAFSKRYTAGCDGHPNMQQQHTMADELRPKVESFMHW